MISWRPLIEADLRAPKADSILVKRNEKFGSRSVRFYSGFLEHRPIYLLPTPGCPPKIKNIKNTTLVWPMWSPRESVRTLFFSHRSCSIWSYLKKYAGDFRLSRGISTYSCLSDYIHFWGFWEDILGEVVRVPISEHKDCPTGIGELNTVSW